MTEFVEVLETVFRDVVPVLGHMGVQVVDASPGRAHLRLPYRNENGNHIGTVYAGVLFSFLETAGGALVLTSLDISKRLPVLVDARIKYLRPVTGAIDAELKMNDQEREDLEALLDANPKATWTLKVQAVDEIGAAVCEAEFVYRFKSLG